MKTVDYQTLLRPGGPPSKEEQEKTKRLWEGCRAMCKDMQFTIIVNNKKLTMGKDHASDGKTT